MGELVDISVVQWERSVALYIEVLGVTMREALFEEWPLLMRRVMDFTPPFQTSGVKGSTDLAIGRAAVNRDIRKTMRPFNPRARSAKLAAILAAKDIAAFNVIASRVTRGPMKNARAVPFSSAVHTSQRNARGTVGRGIGNVVLGSDAPLLAKYIKDVQGNVGIAKAGWLPALLLVGGDAPGYVVKHGLGYGSYIDEHADEDSPSITAINRTPWAVRRDEAQRVVQAALASRAVAIELKITAKVKLAKKAAFDGQAAA